MSYRPFPSIERARHQLGRHDDETPPLPDGSGRPPGLFGQRIVISDEARAATAARLAEVGASLKRAFRRPAGGEETTA